MMTLTCEKARAIVDQALSGPRSDTSRQIAVAVVDAGGHPLSLTREADALPKPEVDPARSVPSA